MSNVSKISFTAPRVADFVCPADKDQAFLWDEKAPGLAIRATRAGAKAYIFQGKLHGKALRVTIGNPKSWSVSEAQAEARRLQTLLDQGVDPREQRAEKAAAHAAKNVEAKRQQVTLRDVWQLYIDDRKSTWGKRHLADHYAVAHEGGELKARGNGETKPGPLASLLATKLSDLTGKKIAAWLEHETATRPTSSALAFRLLRGCLNWCEHEDELKGLVPDGALTDRKVRDTLPEPKSKDDCLQREQLPLWFAAVRQIGNPVISAYLQALLLTGARREELAELRWVDVDFQWAGITINDKVEGSRTIPLTPYVAHLLAALPRRNEWVFSSPMAGNGRLQEPRIAHNQALAAAGLPHLTSHGLRRSFGTLAEWTEMPTGIVAQIMGHKPSAIAEKHYRRRPLDLLRMWHAKLEGWILEQAGIVFSTSEQGKQGLRLVSNN